MEFSIEQQIAFNKYIQKENIFITGPGGTGKSFLIKFIYEDAIRKHKNIHVTALTGCAALLLNCKARTLHSWAGIGLGNGNVDICIKRIIKKKMLKENWKNTEILIIDEVSMMSQRLFELLDGIGKRIRKNNRPFGGIQLIFSGDFYQLPPVGDREQPETINFCFESGNWLDTFELNNHIQLVNIYRQNEEIYQNILNQVREGRLRRSNYNLLVELALKDIPNDLLIKPTKLYPTRNKVDYINQHEMNNLETEEKIYEIKQVIDLPMTTRERLIRNSFTQEDINNEFTYLQSNLRCETRIKLKIGSQVLCIINKEFPNGVVLCNGSQGIVIRYTNDEDSLPVVKYKNGIEIVMSYNVWASETIPGIGVAQIPLILAWALTIHKSQGATLDVAEVDVGSGIFECGQTYVALSRVKSMEGLYLTSFDVNKIKINTKVKNFYDNLNNNLRLTNIENNEISILNLNIITNRNSIEELKEEKIDEIQENNIEEEKKEENNNNNIKRIRINL
jgi:ATP-dependent DNA helicase PIF1